MTMNTEKLYRVYGINYSDMALSMGMYSRVGGCCINLQEANTILNNNKFKKQYVDMHIREVDEDGPLGDPHSFTYGPVIGN